jgi:CheY-like chemotaxis protein/HPt (histidine-containing phosphotransfer) domain-containing protein
VDDLPMNRELAEAFLRTGQHEVMCAADGAQAVAAATAETFDVILMDVCMPGMDGLEATRRIRALGGAAGAVPIVALTAHAFVEQVEECGRAGMDGHVTKPFTPDALLSAVTRASTDKMPVSSVEPSPRHEDLMTGSTKPLFGAELPILQTDAFERTAACLPSDVLAGYLQTLVERSQALLGQLRAPDPPADQKPLTVAAHALAGSAGMFGFERLSVTARHFEHASIAHLPEVGHLTESLIAAAVDTVDEMNRRMAVCA